MRFKLHDQIAGSEWMAEIAMPFEDTNFLDICDSRDRNLVEHSKALQLGR
jgi:hypothetical protein